MNAAGDLGGDVERDTRSRGTCGSIGERDRDRGLRCAPLDSASRDVDGHHDGHAPSPGDQAASRPDARKIVWSVAARPDLVQGRRLPWRRRAVAERDQDEAAPGNSERPSPRPSSARRHRRPCARAQTPSYLGLRRCLRHLHLPLSNSPFSEYVRLRGGDRRSRLSHVCGDSAGSLAARCRQSQQGRCVRQMLSAVSTARAVSWARRRRRRADEARARGRPRRRSETGRTGEDAYCARKPFSRARRAPTGDAADRDRTPLAQRRQPAIRAAVVLANSRWAAQQVLGELSS